MRKNTLTTQLNDLHHLMDAIWYPQTTPKHNVMETESELVLSLELPGVEKQDIDLNITDNRIDIKAKRVIKNAESEQTKTLTRSFALPKGLELDKTSADYKNGVLHIKLPKQEKSKPLHIPIN